MNQGFNRDNGGSNGSGGKNMTVAYLLWFFLGGLGVHRMYMGKMGSGFGMAGLFAASFVGMFVLVGFVGYLALFGWWVYDAFQIKKWCSGGSFVSQSAGQGSYANPVSDVDEPPMTNAA